MKLSLQHNLIYSFIEPNSMQQILAQPQALGYNEIALLSPFFLPPPAPDLLAYPPHIRIDHFTPLPTPRDRPSDISGDLTLNPIFPVANCPPHSYNYGLPGECTGAILW